MRFVNPLIFVEKLHKLYKKMIQYSYQNNLKEDMPMKLEKLQFVVEDGVGIITMNYMKNLNALMIRWQTS